jgi:hypothetical protein
VKLERWLHEWDTFLLIMAVGILTGLITFMAFSPHPAACRQALAHAPGKAHITWACEHP